MKDARLKISLLTLLLLVARPAEAYVGPGLGAGTIAVVLGILASIVMGFLAILWYPAKRLIRKRRAAKQAAGGTQRSRDSS